jgi:hypothetical protein
MTAREAAETYVNHGYRPVPIPSGEKGPTVRKWQELRPSVQDIPKLFGAGPQNIGLILGDAGLADVDCDTPEATVAARILLPATGMVFGRSSKRSSHYFYTSEPATPLVTFKDLSDGKMLVELRCLKKDGTIGLQTVVPPSIHPSGEKIEFEGRRRGPGVHRGGAVAARRDVRRGGGVAGPALARERLPA